ncbi:anti-sigma-D factor RsdA [Hoyosella subflava]|uniref:Anti-sigma-D factor RsdA sigma factor binding region domain-containing protein n=1 Tax=Hoyosella subflava (strain DSM 45089 / JCM 17490 / NBRC 109087 / DQS3-9A1) TaxID=443218 RepID=F6EIH5_HOYSD|nr:anti-sigma-D factor RsdA [Hoyosella subflava]AEF42467.1 hypothetical protein AS9A_4033 [Hoyosella subflava DQS3-9A1]
MSGGVPGEESGVPDISDLLHDDAFLDALSQGSVVDTATDDERELAALLLQWRDDVVAAPMPAGPDLDEVQRVVSDSGVVQALPVHRSRRPARWMTSVAGVAAAAAFVIGGVAVISQSAQPGDPLWGFRQAIHGADETTVMVASLRSELDQAERALDSGDVQRAKEILDSVAPQLGSVGGRDQDELSEKFQNLSERVDRHPDRADVAPVTTSPKRTTGPESTRATAPAPVELPTFTFDPEVLRTVPLPPITEFPLPPFIPQPQLPAEPPPEVTIPPEILRLPPVEVPIEPPPPAETTPPPTTTAAPPAEPTTTVPTTTGRVPTALQPTVTSVPTVDVPSILEQLPLLPDDPRLRPGN